MWYSNNGLQSITVAVDCGSALDHNGLAARTSLWLAYAIRFNTVLLQVQQRWTDIKQRLPILGGSTSRIKEVRFVDSDHFFKELKNLSIASGELASNVTSCA